MKRGSVIRPMCARLVTERSPSPRPPAGAWAHPARGQRDVLVVDGRLALEAVTERDV